MSTIPGALQSGRKDPAEAGSFDDHEGNPASAGSPYCTVSVSEHRLLVRSHNQMAVGSGVPEVPDLIVLEDAQLCQVRICVKLQLH